MTLRADITSGETILYEVDLYLPGTIPILLARRYNSGNSQKTPYGHGWTFNLNISLLVAKDRIIYYDASGEKTVFAPVEEGLQAQNETTGLILQHHPEVYVIYRSPLYQQIFPKAKTVRGKILIDRLEDLNGNKVQFISRGGRLLSLTNTSGSRVELSYRGDCISSIKLTDTQHNTEMVRSLSYDGAGNLVSVTDATGHEIRYTYRNHLMVSYTNRLGGTQYAQYDGEGRCMTLWYEDGTEMRQISYDTLRQTTRVVDTLGFSSLYQFDQNGCVLARIDPTGKRQDYNYDESLCLLAYSTPGGPVDRLEKVENDVVTQIFDGKYLTTCFLNQQGLVTRFSDTLENQYNLEYDARGNLCSFRTPLDAIWNFELDKLGRQTAIVTPEGRRLQFFYSKDGQTLTAEDEIGLCYRVKCDDMGRPVEQQDALGRQWRRSYDTAGSLAEEVMQNHSVIKVTYDKAGHPIDWIDADGIRTAIKYDAFGRLLECSGPDGSYKFQYDREGRLISAENSENKRLSLVYGTNGRLVCATMPDGSRVTYWNSEEDTGPDVKREHGETVLVYSPSGMLKEQIHSDGTVRRFQYGPMGSLVSVESGDQRIDFEYDAEGRIVSFRKDAAALVLSYDQDGNLHSVLDESAFGVEFLYDQRGRLTGIHDKNEADYRLTYDEADRLTAIHLPLEQRCLFQYDVLDRLVEYGRIDENGQQHVQPVAPERPMDPIDLSLVFLQSAPVDSNESPTDLNESVNLTLIPSGDRLVLAAAVGDFDLPIWLQENGLIKGENDLRKLFFRSALNGLGAAVSTTRYRSGFMNLERWTGVAEDGFSSLHPALSLPMDPSRQIPILNPSFLTRRLYDYFYPHNIPGHLASHQTDLLRSPDQVVTGTHMMGYLRNAAWDMQTRAYGLPEVHLLNKPGGPKPADVITLFAIQT